MKQQCSSSLENQKKQLSNFHKDLQASQKMETEKIINLLKDSSNEKSKFATKNGMLQTVNQQKVNTSKQFYKI